MTDFLFTYNCLVVIFLHTSISIYKFLNKNVVTYVLILLI